MNVDFLNDKAVETIFRKLLTELLADEYIDIDSQRDLLEVLVNALDDGDQMDCFGTEGWKHRYGLED
jgi:hypothetical protein